MANILLFQVKQQNLFTKNPISSQNHKVTDAVYTQADWKNLLLLIKTSVVSTKFASLKAILYYLHVTCSEGTTEGST